MTSAADTTNAADPPAAPDAADAATPPEKKSSGIKSLLWLALFAWVLRSLVIAPFSIPSGSMLPTMWIGDYLFVSKWPYGYSRYSLLFDFPPFEGRIAGGEPKRGDIVIFRLPSDDRQDWVKRVIGLPGDRVAVSEGTIILNGQPVPRVAAGEIAIPVSANSPCRPFPLARVSYDTKGDAACVVPAYRETLPGGPTYLTLNGVDGGTTDDFPEVTVPDGKLFVMGDNRDDSADSRVAPADGPSGGVGFLPLDNLVGRAMLPFWSTDGSASYLNPISWFTALRTDRIGASYNREQEGR